MSKRHHLKSNQDPFANLPSEIIIDILSKLCIRTIISCKCVCKSWLALLESPEFVNSHLLNAIPGLITCNTKFLHFLEFEDGLDLQHHYKSVAKFNLPNDYRLTGVSVDGLLCLCNLSKSFAICICNPITRDYIELDYTKEFFSVLDHFGFGASKISGQHKVVIILQDSPSTKSDMSMCHIYTLETGLWKRISNVAHHDRPGNDDLCKGTFLNGNLHWLVVKDSGLQISCFDLEAELFSSFSSPLSRSSTAATGLSALDDCLCLSDSSSGNGFALWFMKEYGVEKSWIKHFFICNGCYIIRNCNIFPVKVFKDGDILMIWKRVLEKFSTKYP